MVVEDALEKPLRDLFWIINCWLFNSWSVMLLNSSSVVTAGDSSEAGRLTDDDAPDDDAVCGIPGTPTPDLSGFPPSNSRTM
jgi:hypothetical protein